MPNVKALLNCILKLFKLEGKYLNQKENHHKKSSDQKVEFIGESTTKNGTTVNQYLS